MDPDALVGDETEIWEDFVPFLRSLDVGDQMLRQVFFPLCGPALLRCRTVSRLWRDTINELTRPHSSGHAVLRRSIAWSTLDVSVARVTKIAKERLYRCEVTSAGKIAKTTFNKNEVVVLPEVVIMLDWAHSPDEPLQNVRNCALDLQICERKKTDKILLRQSFDGVRGITKSRQPFTICTSVIVHKKTLVVCCHCYNGQEEPIEMRFISVCLSKLKVIHDVTRPIGDGFTHLWIERQVIETGRDDVRQQILMGIKENENDKSLFHFRVDAAGYIFIAKVVAEHTYDVRVYDPDLYLVISRQLRLQWPISNVQYQHPITSFTMESSRVGTFWALWNVEMRGSPAALWCESILRSTDTDTLLTCELKTSTHLYLESNWFKRPGCVAESTQHSLVPPEKAINSLSGETRHPPEPTRSYFELSDLVSPWRLQAQQGQGILRLTSAGTPCYSAHEDDKCRGVPLVRNLRNHEDVRKVFGAFNYFSTSDSPRDDFACYLGHWSMVYVERKEVEIIDFSNLKEYSSRAIQRKRKQCQQ